MGVETVARLNHGMTHSAYVQDPDGNGIEVHYTLPSELWETDVNGALNYVQSLPSSGSETLEDTTDYVRFSGENP
jgi:catechol 2,3-dioxygenase